MAQLTGLIGQLGQILSAVPLVRLLHGPGWTTTYLLAASLSVLVLMISVLVLQDEPPGVRTDQVSPSIREVRDQLAAVFRHPGTRLGLWTHFTTQYSGTAFALLWGYPFLVSGQGRSPRTAGLLLTVFVLGMTLILGLPYSAGVVAPVWLLATSGALLLMRKRLA